GGRETAAQPSWRPTTAPRSAPPAQTRLVSSSCTGHALAPLCQRSNSGPFVTASDILVAAPPARGAPRTPRGLVLLLRGLLLLRHLSDHLLPSADFGRATLKGSAALVRRGARIVRPLACLSRARAARRT